MTITIDRNGETMDITATLGELQQSAIEEEDSSTASSGDSSDGYYYYYGNGNDQNGGSYSFGMPYGFSYGY